MYDIFQIMYHSYNNCIKVLLWDYHLLDLF